MRAQAPALPSLEMSLLFYSFDKDFRLFQHTLDK